MRKLLFIIMLLLPLFSFGDTMEELETYINSRIYNTPPPEGGHCGFRWQIELNMHFHELSPDMQKLAKTLMQPPARQDSLISPSGHFMLHYDRNGDHAVPSADSSGNGVPDYIDSAAVILDHVWHVEVDEMGFQAPPNQEGETVDIYHVCFTKFRYYGLTCFTMEDIPSLPGINYTSYIEIHSDFESGFYTKGLDALKVTAAHEFNHAIQLGYQFRGEDIFFMEMTSTWMEDYVYNQVNDYIQYLNRFIPNISDIRFNACDGWSEYGNSIFMHMLEKKYGAEIAVEMWEQIVKEPALTALNTILKNKGSSLGRSQNEYAAWLFYTGSRAAPDQFFPEGENYPQIKFNTDDKHYFGSGLNLNKSIEGLCMRHVLIYGLNNYKYKYNLTSQNTSGFYNNFTPTDFPKEPVCFNYPQVLRVSIPDTLILAITNPKDVSITDLNYILMEDSTIFIEVGPNPVKPDDDVLTFYNVPPNSHVTILTINGRIVKEFKMDLNLTCKNWDLKDKLNKRVASGVYIYFIKSGDLEKKGKIAVIR